MKERLCAVGILLITIESIPADLVTLAYDT